MRRVSLTLPELPRNADEDGEESERGEKAKGLLDWDGAWKQIQREIKGTGTLDPNDLVDRSVDRSTLR